MERVTGRMRLRNLCSMAVNETLRFNYQSCSSIKYAIESSSPVLHDFNVLGEEEESFQILSKILGLFDAAFGFK